MLEKLSNKFYNKIECAHVGESDQIDHSDKVKIIKDVIKKAPRVRTKEEIQEVAELLHNITFFKTRAGLSDSDIC